MSVTPPGWVAFFHPLSFTFSCLIFLVGGMDVSRHLHLPGFPWIAPSYPLPPRLSILSRSLTHSTCTTMYFTLPSLAVWSGEPKVVSIRACHHAQHRPHPGDDGTRDETQSRRLPSCACNDLTASAAPFAPARFIEIHSSLPTTPPTRACTTLIVNDNCLPLARRVPVPFRIGFTA